MNSRGFQISQRRAVDAVQCLLSLHEALGLILSLAKIKKEKLKIIPLKCFLHQKILQKLFFCTLVKLSKSFASAL
jgi:hypothetical protein